MRGKYIKFLATIFVLSLFCGFANFWVRDSARISQETELQTAYRLFSAITIEYGLEHDGNFPESDWTEISKYVQGASIDPQFLERTVYNDIAHGHSEYPSDDMPGLVTALASGKYLVIFYNESSREMSFEELVMHKAHFSNNSWKKVKNLNARSI